MQSEVTAFVDGIVSHILTNTDEIRASIQMVSRQPPSVTSSATTEPVFINVGLERSSDAFFENVRMVGEKSTIIANRDFLLSTVNKHVPFATDDDNTGVFEDPFATASNSLDTALKCAYSNTMPSEFVQVNKLLMLALGMSLTLAAFFTSVTNTDFVIRVLCVTCRELMKSQDEMLLARAGELESGEADHSHLGSDENVRANKTLARILGSSHRLKFMIKGLYTNFRASVIDLELDPDNPLHFTNESKQRVKQAEKMFFEQLVFYAAKSALFYHIEGINLGAFGEDVFLRTMLSVTDCHAYGIFTTSGTRYTCPEKLLSDLEFCRTDGVVVDEDTTRPTPAHSISGALVLVGSPTAGSSSTARTPAQHVGFAAFQVTAAMRASRAAA
jgi:hypothetical protein